MKRKHFLSRRQFLVLSAGSILAGRGWSLRAADKKANPFQYDVSSLRKTDPALIRFDLERQWTVPFAKPKALSLASDGKLWAVGEKVLGFQAADSGDWAQTPLPEQGRAVAIAPEGEVYVALRDRVQVHGKNGELQSSWPSFGARAFITGLAIGKNELFAADAGQRIIWRCDRSGKSLGRIGEKNPDRNIPGFIIPSPYFEVEIAPDGLLRVNNPGRHRVEAYTADGDLEFYWGEPSAGIRGFCGCCNPISVALMPDGRHVTFEKGLPRVKVYSADGKFEGVVAGAESFPENGQGPDQDESNMGGLAGCVDPSGKVYILDLATAKIHLMRPKAGPAGAAS